MSENARLFEIMGFLEMAHMLFETEIAAVGETYAMADANAMTVDAISQVRGELNARIGNQLSEITAIVVRGVAA